MGGAQGKAGGKMYADFEGDRDRGDFSVLPELHSVLSGMKVQTTTVATVYQICSRIPSMDS